MSVSRVGGAAQTKAMKKVAGRLRLELAQYRELASFAQFGTSDLDAVTRAQLERGQRIIEVLKQDQYAPASLAEQVMIMYGITNGHLDDVPVEKIKTFESAFLEYVKTSAPDIAKGITETKDITDEIANKLNTALGDFKSMASF